MIVDRMLTVAERRSSQYKLCGYWCFLALGMACCGDAVLPLLAMELNVPDSVTAMLGAMTYGGFLFLPLGFILGGYFGAGRSMFGECLAMALAAGLLAWAGFKGSSGLFFAGVLLYFLSRSVNFAMRFSLQQNIATADEMPSMLARNYIGLHSCSLLGFLLVSLVLHWFAGSAILSWVLIGGGVFFFCAGRAVLGVCESGSVRQQAARPVVGQVKLAWSDPLIRHQIWAGTLLNLIASSVVPMNILAARRGIGVEAATVVMLTAVQALASVFGSVLVRQITQRSGPRTMMLAGYPLLWMLCICWLVIPENCAWFWLMIPFALSGVLLMAFGTSLENYFLVTAEPKQQIGGTFLVFVITGGVAGVLGMLLNWGLFKLGSCWLAPDGGAMKIYHFYYLTVGILFAAGILLPWSLPEKRIKEEK